MQLRIGSVVRAVEQVTEEWFADEEFHIHAEAGDLGVVAVLDGPWITVVWRSSGTATACHLSEITLGDDDVFRGSAIAC